MHVRDADQNRVGYQLVLTDSLPTQNIQLITAIPNPDPEPKADPGLD